MNLLYLLVLTPFFTFFLLTCIGRFIRSSHVIVIGVGSALVMALIVVFVCIDYQTNTVPDASLNYYRHLWNWFSIDNITIPFTLLLDGLSLTFLILIVFFANIIYLFSLSHLNSFRDIYIFYAYGHLLIASMLTLVLVDNLLVMLLSWEGVSISAYFLIGIYYQRIRNSYAAIKSFIMMHFTDVFLIIGICMLFSELGTLNITDVLASASANLAIDSDIVFWATLMLFLGAMSKSALFPMHTWFIETTHAPMPATALMQSATAILAGIYLVLRLNNLFVMSSDVLALMAVISAFTIIFANIVALVQQDIKRIITYINLSQISYLFLACANQNWDMSLSFLVNYTMTSALLILSTAILLKTCNGERDIRKLGGLAKQRPILYIFFLFIGISMSSIPLISFSFYIKGDIIWGLINQDKLGVGTIALFGILLSTLSIFRIIFIIFHNKYKITSLNKINPLQYGLLAVLVIFSSILLISFQLPIEGIVPIAELDTNGQLLFQLLLASVALLGILIAYVFFVNPHQEILEILTMPIVKSFIRLSTNEWKFEYLLNILFVQRYLQLANFFKTDPLGAWDKWIMYSIKKINSYIVALENGQLRWYTLSIVSGGVILLMLLIFI